MPHRNLVSHVARATLASLASLYTGCSDANGSAPDAQPAQTDASLIVDAPPPASLTPILLVHGIDGSAADFDALQARLRADGWDASNVFAFTFADAKWGCNVDNASTIKTWIETILTTTGAPEVNVIAHSMGTLSSRHFVKQLGGTDMVARYITLGGMHHGLSSSCLATFPGAPCVWRELCESGEFVAQLNAVPATPGNLHWVSIYGTADETVPNSSSQLAGAENISMPGVDHVGLLDDAATYAQIKRVLEYPAL